MTSDHILQIFLRVTIQNQIRVAQRIIVDEVIQLRPLRHGRIQRILDTGAVDGNFAPIPEQQLHTAGAHVKLTGSCIVLHNLASLLPYGTLTVVTFVIRSFF